MIFKFFIFRNIFERTSYGTTVDLLVAIQGSEPCMMGPMWVSLRGDFEFDDAIKF